MAGIYLHIPFCRQACTYCNFHFSTLLNYKDEVLKAMLLEIQKQQDFFTDKTVIDTIYFGGGTPSVLTTDEINLLTNALYRFFSISENPEITMEANPDDLSKRYLSELKSQTIINRLSIGVQSFIEEDLRYMNRVHSADDALKSIKNAQDAGFHILSVDLIYGTPTMNIEQWQTNLAQVYNLHIPHISCYALTVEEKTELAALIKKNKKEAPDEEQIAQQFSILTEQMRAHNYIHYEISNFGKEGHFARHNSNYWKGIPYLGIGPSAHSYNGETRFWNISNNALYIKKMNNDEPIAESEFLTETDRYNEYIMTGIRTIYGIDSTKLKNEFGESFVQHFLLEISPFISNRWVLETNGIYTLTDSGKLFCDYITEHLFTEK